MDTILIKLRALTRLTDNYPSSLQGQQRHFAVDLPTAWQELVEALTDVLDLREREILRSVLIALDGPEDD